jgi:hypothetical protein
MFDEIGLASESHLQCELHGTGASLLVLGSYRAKTLIEHLGCGTEGCICQVPVDVAEVRMIEDVEGFGAELEFRMIQDSEVTPRSQIDLLGSKSSNQVSWCVSGFSSGGRNKCRLGCKRTTIDRAAPRILGAV